MEPDHGQAAPAGLERALAERYRLVRLVGRGGMAKVYEAEDLRHQRRVAIKVLDPEPGAALGVERFLHEIETAARLSHPHILPIHDSGHAAGALYYVMPLVEEVSLRQRMDREVQLPWREAVRFACEIAEALDYAHRHGVIHRDIKPENVLVASGHAVVADFGIAKVLGALGEEHRTATGVTLGTPAYMSPEQASGDRRIDGRCDIYGLGCLLYEMLAGQPPYTGVNSLAVIGQHLSAPLPDLDAVRPGLPPALPAAARKALAKSPADRYEDAMAFGRALEATLQSPAVDPAPALRATNRASLRLRVWITGLSLAGAIAAVVAMGPWLAGRRESRIRALAILPLVDLSPDRSQEYFADGMTDQLIGEIGRLGALRVISRTSSMAYKATHKPLPQIARELHVDAILEGSVVQSGDRVRVALELFQASPERPLWTERFERELRDILGMQAEIASLVASRLHARISTGVNARTERRVVHPEAFRAVLKGRYLLDRMSGSGYRAAIQEFERATRLDPLEATGWAGLADGFYELSSVYMPAKEAMPKARAAAERALALDPQLAAAHATLGMVLAQYEWGWDEALSRLRKAIELNPNDARGHMYFASVLTELGRAQEALYEWSEAKRLDPLSLYIETGAIQILYYSGRYEEADSAYRTIIARDSSYVPPRYMLSLVLAEEGRWEEALAEARTALRMDDTGFSRAVLGYIYGRMGRKAEARRIVDALEPPPGAYGSAIVFCGLRDWNHMFESLENCIAIRQEEACWLGVHPIWHPVRSDPRFQALLTRVHLASTAPQGPS